jgi:hypothetical protein
MTDNSEMELINALFRSELEKFKDTDDSVKREVVRILQEAGALSWMREVCANDPDPQIQDYVRLAEDFDA